MSIMNVSCSLHLKTKECIFDFKLDQSKDLQIFQIYQNKSIIPYLKKSYDLCDSHQHPRNAITGDF